MSDVSYTTIAQLQLHLACFCLKSTLLTIDHFPHGDAFLYTSDQALTKHKHAICSNEQSIHTNNHTNESKYAQHKPMQEQIYTHEPQSENNTIILQTIYNMHIVFCEFSTQQ